VTRPVKDVAASVRQRLQNTARKTNRPFQEVLGYCAMERFLYRLACSPHAGQFVLKGALMLRAWNAPAGLEVVVSALGTFLLPIAEALHGGRAFDRAWQPPGPWRQATATDTNAEVKPGSEGTSSP
jgi:hypothetical protein